MMNIVRAEEEEEEEVELAAIYFPSTSSSSENLLFLEISNSIRSPYPEPFSVPSPSPSPSGSTIAILFLTNSIIILENGGVSPVLRYNVVIPLKSLTLSLVSDSDPIEKLFASNGYTEVKVVKNSFLRSNATMMKSLRIDCHESIDNVLASSGYTQVLDFSSLQKVMGLVNKMKDLLRYERYESVSPLVFRQTSRNTGLLPVSSTYTSQIANLNGCNQQSSSRSMPEPTEQSQFLNSSQVFVMPETPMPELVQEDYLLDPPPPQIEQPTTDTVPHMNHTFPPDSTRLVEGRAINIGEGDFRSASQTVDASGILLETNIARSIEIDLRPFLGKIPPANKVGVSKSTVKRKCREHGISEWPYKKSNKREYSPSELKGAKTGASVQSSSLAMPFPDALPSKPLVQAPDQYFQSDTPAFNPPPRQLSTVTAAQTSPPVTIKATYDGTNTIIKFDLPSSATKDDLEGKVAKKLNLKVGSFTIKYQDQESDWITVTDSEDLQHCIGELRSLATITSITMLVQSTSSGSGPT